MVYHSPLQDLFASSPIKPMQRHVGIVYNCAQTLMPFMKAVFDNDWDLASTRQAEISRRENEADELKRIIRTNLPKGLFMAIDRRDLLELLSSQDRIANKTKDIAGVMLGRQLNFPASLHENILVYLNRCIEAIELAVQAVNELDELITAGFKGQESKIVTKMIDELEKIEHDTDEKQIVIRQLLHALESELSPVDLIFMYKIIDWIGGLADNAQLVGDRLELMVTR